MQKVIDLYPDTNHTSHYLYLTEEEKEDLLNWCKSFNQIPTINEEVDSYILKRIYERDHNTYITNGAIKRAMEITGFKVANRNAINWKFNISKECVNKAHANPQ